MPQRCSLYSWVALLLLLAASLPGCDTNVGSLVLTVTRSWDPAQEPLANIADRVRVRVDGPDLVVGPEDFDYASRQGVLPEVPVGEDRVLTVEGLGPERNIVSRGRSTPLVIRDGENAVELFVGLTGKQGEFSFTANRMNEARAFHSATQLGDGRVLFAGGTAAPWRFEPLGEPGQLRRSVELLEENSLRFSEQDAPCAVPGQGFCMLAPRLGHTATALSSGNVLLAGGIHELQAFPNIEVYDPADRHFYKDDAELNRSWHSAAPLAAGVLLVGGVDASLRLSAAAALYSKGELRALPSLSQPRRAFSLSLLAGGELLVCGGIDDQGRLLASCERLPGQDAAAWIPGSSLTVARAYHSATTLGDGTVLFVGGLGREDGQGADRATSLVERFAPQSGEVVTLEDQLSLGRWAHTASQLIDGRVLVVGGYGADRYGAAMASVEVIQLFPTSLAQSHVRPLANLRQPRAGHSATLLQNGVLLVAGGVSGDATLDTAEVFVY